MLREDRGRQGILVAKRNDIDVARKEDAKALGILVPTRAARHAVPKLEEHNRGDRNRCTLGRDLPQPVPHRRRAFRSSAITALVSRI
jgi:hypothetical protein